MLYGSPVIRNRSSGFLDAAVGLTRFRMIDFGKLSGAKGISGQCHQFKGEPVPACLCGGIREKCLGKWPDRPAVPSNAEGQITFICRIQTSDPVLRDHAISKDTVTFTRIRDAKKYGKTVSQGFLSFFSSPGIDRVIVNTFFFIPEHFVDTGQKARVLL